MKKTKQITLTWNHHKHMISISSPNDTFIHHLTDKPKKIVFYCSGCKVEPKDDNLFLHWKRKLNKKKFRPADLVHYATDRKGNDFFFIYDSNKSSYLLVNDKEVRVPIKFCNEDDYYPLIDDIARMTNTIATAQRNDSIY